MAGVPEKLVSRMRVDNSTLINVLSREEDAFPVLRRLLQDNHEDRRSQLRLSRRALRLARSLVHSGVLSRLDEPDEFGRRYVLTVDLPEDFALNQPLAHFALAALEVLDPDSPDHALDVVSVIEAVLEGPRQVLFAQQRVARDAAIAEMKADGLEYDERMRLLDEVTWPQPLAELLEATYEIYRQAHPWLTEDALGPKSIVREMYENGMSFTDFVGRYQLARSEGLVLRYLTDAYRTLRQTVPEEYRVGELADLIEWLGETVRQTDSSLLDEWEALGDPDHAVAHRHRARAADHTAPDLPAGTAVPGDGAQRDVATGRAGGPRQPRRADGPGARRRRPDRSATGGGDDPVDVGLGDRGVLRRARPSVDGRRRARPRPAPDRGDERRTRRGRRGRHGTALASHPDHRRPRRATGTG